MFLNSICGHDNNVTIVLDSFGEINFSCIPLQQDIDNIIINIVFHNTQ